MLPLQEFKNYISQNELFTSKDRILLAVSGGKDSVLMAHLFKLSGYDFGIAHCNFNLRAEESHRDESFVKMLAATLEVPFHVVHFNTKAHAALHKVSTQMAARDLRYRWFEQIRTAYGYDLIGLAQHQDDAIETVLLNLIRGTGIAGMHGILPKRAQLIRPLLFLSRKQIEESIAAGKFDYVEDSSNLSANYARNKLRLKVIPHLKEINPNLEQTFEHNIQRFTDTELVLQNVISDLKERLFIPHKDAVHLSIKEIVKLKPQKLLVFELLRPYGFSEAVVTEIISSLNKQSGTSFFSPTHRVTINREVLILSVVQEASAQNALIHAHDKVARLQNVEINISYPEIPYFEKDNRKAFVDADQLIYPLVIRTRQEGDKFIPIGMKGFKKLSDFLIDAKVPLVEKDQVPLLINGNGTLIWVAGLRQDQRYIVTDKTKKVVVFELK